MRRFRNVTAKQLIRALEIDGFCKTRQKGSHIIFRKGSRRVIVAIHRPSDSIPIGTLARNIRDAGWSEDDLKRLKL